MTHISKDININTYVTKGTDDNDLSQMAVTWVTKGADDN